MKMTATGRGMWAGKTVTVETFDPDLDSSRSEAWPRVCQIIPWWAKFGNNVDRKIEHVRRYYARWPECRDARFVSERLRLSVETVQAARERLYADMRREGAATIALLNRMNR